MRKRRITIKTKDSKDMIAKKSMLYQFVADRLESLGYYLQYNVTPLENHNNVQLVIHPHNGLEESIAILIIKEVKEDLTSPAKGYLKFRY